jgi:hypothetical protein
MRIFAGLTMQKTSYSGAWLAAALTVTEYRFDILDFPNAERVGREEVVKVMMDSMPDSVQGGTVLFFYAEPEYIS